ncbi:MAG: secretin N-terminal domain-containing protein [Gammaproteobacteria bacterium]|nr:secretin N-terminal domain-containing protein [Gammaproteobacteria bacterium]
MIISARAIVLATALTLLAGCVTPPPAPSAAHLQQPVGAPAGDRAQIPAPVTRSLDLPQPQAQKPLERYTVCVNGVPAAELLFSLARDARVNLDVHPDVRGVVTLNAIDQTLPQILNRIAAQVDMRYTLEDDLLTVVPDTPFVRVYRVDYLNMSRDASSRTSIATQVATTGGTGGETGAGGSATAAGNNSNTEILNTAQNRYWESLTESLKALLQETDKLLPGGDDAAAGEGKDKEGARTQPNLRLREAASVIVQPETGVLAVRATSRQHARVQEFLDSSVRSARRQVLIEATVVEVELSDGYEQGIDWSAVRRGASSQIGFTLRPGGSVSELPGGTTVGGTVPTLGLLEFVESGKYSDIAGAVRLLESFGRTRVLSSPKISALNNQTALIKVVENLVYFQLKADFTPGTAGSPTTFTVTSTPSTVPVGFLMNVTPQIAASDEVVLNLRPTISRLSGFVEDPGVALSLALARQSGAQLPDVSSRVPEIQTREMESVIKVRDGQIAVLGGLMREEATQGVDQVPGVGRVPGVGELFKYRSRRGRKSELVIFLRPVIVRDPSVEGDYAAFRGMLPDAQFFGAGAGAGANASAGAATGAGADAGR